MSQGEVLEKNELRALVVLKTIVDFTAVHGRVPRQADLFRRIPAVRDERGEIVQPGRGEGAIVDTWNSLEGIEDEYPYPLTHIRQIYDAVLLLRGCGLLRKPPANLRGRARAATAYVPSAKGKALVANLPANWRLWKSLSEFC